MPGFGSKRRFLIAVAVVVAVGLPLLVQAQSGGFVFLPVMQRGFTPDPSSTSLTLIEQAR
ncbi:MAG: hypothetical protein ACYC5O_15320 [Anaerolineae bacterium]